MMTTFIHPIQLYRKLRNPSSLSYERKNNMAKKKSNFIKLPSDCLSYSQVSLWLTSPGRYKEIYFNLNDSARFMNSAMAYGSVVADALENDQETGDLLTDMAMSLLVKYDIRDKEMEGVLKTKDGDIRIVSHPDTMDSKTLAIREYKTGKAKWTQKRADNWFQLKFYAMLVYIVYGKMPASIHLDWIETFSDLSDNGVIKPTGRVETFEVKLTLKDVLETMATVSRVAKEIEVAWAMHEKPVEIPF